MTIRGDRRETDGWRIWTLKAIWIALRLALAVALAERGSYFFYQGF